ncbi:UDP-N-acetylmuramoyl-L-alanine--D-glutamate ligase [Alteribacter keqinensis]|uniref:UDP-N-acetylmuramoylalanine--D-glutamate ligase n=1 Tax=Alteribacter keqinensis TaxID=2483800 RepID=A0A3M7TWP2_9BACI|nr:UDP-N-acetylmuramoyl-L-alanine--D-glutamate ligase [Alteribacter keqinensis]RNA69689.1 UDP-N-acetylmuramoyl-L-alanine--D-glutamate ligase [Alteribacter keqinensis]
MKAVSDFKGKDVLVLGLAKSGTAAALLLHELGARVTVNDQKPLEENEAARSLEKAGCRVICGEHPSSLIQEGLSCVVKNPGIRYDNPLIEKALRLGIPVITEVELAYRVSEAPIVGITGSNGKTTTTTLVHEMLQNGTKHPLIAGNIGKVSCEVAKNAGPENVMVTELSSFQLMGVEAFKPQVAVLLNIIDAHLDYHGNREAYAEAKARLFKNTDENSVLVYNFDDPLVRRLAERAEGIKMPFSVREQLNTGASLSEDGYLTVNGEAVIHKDEMSLPGEHNIENALAAALTASVYDVNRKDMASVLMSFTGVKHRLQFVKNLNGRAVYNNSKATNIPATITALKAFDKPIVLIAGGLDRGNEFDDLLPWLKNVHSVVTYGETAEKVARVAREAGAEVISVQTLDEAVPEAYRLTNEGDILLLSPACASWDQFKTFEERGDRFIEAVEKLGS